MLFRVLGPVEVWSGGAWAGVSAPKVRALLALLALRPGRVVSAGELADELWDGDPPEAARKLVSGYVLRARRLIGDPDGQVLVTRAPGYLLAVERAEADASRFEQLVAAGREALDGGDALRAADLLAGALALWRGPALSDVAPGPLIADAASRLEEQRLDAAELRIEADLGSGRAAELVAELRELTAGYPLRERFWHQLMRVLEGSGRPAEALEVYGRARAVLAAELGADPGPDLQELHRELLVGDPAPLGRRRGGRSGLAAAAAAAAAPAVLRQLPATAPRFAGREAEMAGLLSQDDAEHPGTVVITAIDGMPGVGKTALAVHAGHLLAGRFPDRQLFVDLHGHTPGQGPADPADVLAELLAADGADPRYLPGRLAGRAAMWRDRLAGRRVLLILDNAASSAQVGPLLPGTAGCLVLVTSRRFLGDLPAAVQIPLGVLPPGDAAAMLTGLAPRAAREPARVAELAALCGHLPLAVALLARLLARHPSWDLASLITETRTRLLTTAAENRTVAAAFDLSYQDLTPAQQRLFRYLGRHPGTDTDAYAAAALAGLPLADTVAHLDALHGSRLLEEPVPHRYRMHDLIRQYARSLAADQDADEQDQAARRLFDYYQHTAEAAGAQLTRHTRSRAPSPVPAPAAAPAVRGYDLARAWMTAERANLLACVEEAAAREDHDRVTGLASAVAPHLRNDGPWPQAVTLHTAAAQAARLRGDQPGQANALLNLGEVGRLTSDHPSAARALEQARDIYRSTGDQIGEANALTYLGDVRQLADDFPGAASALEQALDISRGTGDRLAEANALTYLGMVRRLTGDYQAATSLLEKARDICRDIGNQPGQILALRELGAVQQETGDCQAAASVLEQALDISRGTGDRLAEANALFYLGEVRQMTGDYRAAAGLLEQARGIYRDIGSPLGQANVLRNLGIVRRLAGDYPAAARLVEQALDIYRDIGERLGRANALVQLGTVRRLTGDYPAAAGLLEQALDIYRDIGNPAGELDVLNEIGTIHLARGDTQRARASYLRALELARSLGSRLGEAVALEGIGRCAAAAPARDPLDQALGQALEIYRSLGTADAARLAAELDESRRNAAVPAVRTGLIRDTPAGDMPDT
jgi:DNA-binding SARP family transcriptional activator/tetratricopeptide (TPR) repeat protein